METIGSLEFKGQGLGWDSDFAAYGSSVGRSAEV